MTAQDQNDETPKALATLGVGPAAAELYKDMLGPAAREMGHNLLAVAKVISLVFAPLRGLVWGTEKLWDWLSVAMLKRMASVPPENIVAPPPYLAGQILLQLPFCADQDRLREMYANLLSASMDSRSVEQAHPAFVHVIQQLIPAEAQLLQYLSTQKGFRLEEVPNAIGERNTISRQFQTLCGEAKIGNVEQSDRYLDNLLRLRILADVLPSGGPTVSSAIFVSYGAHLGTLVSPDVTKRVVMMTAFGEAFVATCMGKSESGEVPVCSEPPLSRDRNG